MFAAVASMIFNPTTIITVRSHVQYKQGYKQLKMAHGVQYESSLLVGHSGRTTKDSRARR